MRTERDRIVEMMSQWELDAYELIGGELPSVRAVASLARLDPSPSVLVIPAAEDDVPVVALKFCRKCQREKPRSMFRRDSGKPDGLYAHCKLCQYHVSTKTVSPEWQAA